MAKELLEDSLWDIVAPLLPAPKPRRFRYPERKPLENRKVLTGILFVLKSDISWEYLPKEMGCGSGISCWRRLKEWQEVGKTLIPLKTLPHFINPALYGIVRSFSP